MNRGSSLELSLGFTSQPCFNEAPIHESGKCEAAAESHTNPQASMRPRFMNRGSTVAVPFADLGTTRFNEAPIHESGK